MSQESLRVLIVDDEAALREVLLLRLRGWGYDARAAKDVEEAEARIDTWRPDVVVTDVVLPGSSGIDLLRRLKAARSEEHTSKLQSRENLVCRLLLEKKK